MCCSQHSLQPECPQSMVTASLPAISSKHAGQVARSSAAGGEPASVAAPAAMKTVSLSRSATASVSATHGDSRRDQQCLGGLKSANSQPLPGTHVYLSTGWSKELKTHPSTGRNPIENALRRRPPVTSRTQVRWNTCQWPWPAARRPVISHQ